MRAWTRRPRSSFPTALTKSTVCPRRAAWAAKLSAAPPRYSSFPITSHRTSPMLTIFTARPPVSGRRFQLFTRTLDAHSIHRFSPPTLRSSSAHPLDAAGFPEGGQRVARRCQMNGIVELQTTEHSLRIAHRGWRTHRFLGMCAIRFPVFRMLTRGDLKSPLRVRNAGASSNCELRTGRRCVVRESRGVLSTWWQGAGFPGPASCGGSVPSDQA